jgi:hypothetical protein
MHSASFFGAFRSIINLDGCAIDALEPVSLELPAAF